MIITLPSNKMLLKSEYSFNLSNKKCRAVCDLNWSQSVLARLRLNVLISSHLILSYWQPAVWYPVTAQHDSRLRSNMEGEPYPRMNWPYSPNLIYPACPNMANLIFPILGSKSLKHEFSRSVSGAQHFPSFLSQSQLCCTSSHYVF